MCDLLDSDVEPLWPAGSSGLSAEATWAEREDGRRQGAFRSRPCRRRVRALAAHAACGEIEHGKIGPLAGVVSRSSPRQGAFSAGQQERGWPASTASCTSSARANFAKNADRSRAGAPSESSCAARREGARSHSWHAKRNHRARKPRRARQRRAMPPSHVMAISAARNGFRGRGRAARTSTRCWSSRRPNPAAAREATVKWHERALKMNDELRRPARPRREEASSISRVSRGSGVACRA